MTGTSLIKSIQQAEALEAWSKALSAYASLPLGLQQVAQAKVEEKGEVEAKTLTKTEAESKAPSKLFAVYRKFSASGGSSADDRGNGNCGGDRSELVGIATDRKSATEIIKIDSYNLSARGNIYSAVLSELDDWNDGVDYVGFGLRASWKVELITPNHLLPDFEMKREQGIPGDEGGQSIVSMPT